MPYDDVLLENHYEFLNTHRGRVVRQGAHARVDGARPEFQYLVQGEGDAPRAWRDEARMVHRLPTASDGDGWLSSRGFRPSGGITYMTLEASPEKWRAEESVLVRRVENEPDMETFSDVQTRGFLENSPAYDEWRAFLGAANRNNLGSPSQSFYVGTIGGDPAGVVLAVQTAALVGIYAVATAPAHRNKGVSTTLLRRAVENAMQAGASRITLQVASGSYAHRFYEKLGFRTAFEAAIFRAA